MKITNVFKSGTAAPENLEARAVVIHMASQLGVGQFASQLCPACDGGASKERSLSMDVGTNGVIKFYCHRAACGFQGNCYSTPGMTVHARPALENVSHLNPLTADLHPLSERELAYFEKRYSISPDCAKREIRRTTARYALRIVGPSGRERGWITRRPYSDSPADTTANRDDSQYAQKALTFMEKDEPVLSWYSPQENIEDGDRGIYLVEDQLSAMRLVEYFAREFPGHNMAAVALLGSGINAGKVAEIQQQDLEHNRTVHIALDKDATGAAFAMARKWGQAFTSCRVIVLEKDIKDCSDDELSRLPL